MTSRRVRATSPSRIAAHFVLMVGVLLFVFPFYWLIVMATSSTAQIYSVPPRLFLGTSFFENFGKVLEGSTFLTAFANSIWLTIVSVAIHLFLAALAGYVFAKVSFPGRNTLFAILLATMLIPTGVSLVPTFQIYADLGWLNTYLPLIVPGAVSAFGVFWMRQAASSAVSDEVIDAAKIDGAGFMRTFLQVALPSMRPALVAFGIFQVMWTWNDYLWPLLVLGKPSMFTLPIALQQLQGNYGTTDYSVVMAGTLVAILPLIILFFFLRKTILENVSAGALKG